VDDELEALGQQILPQHWPGFAMVVPGATLATMRTATAMPASARIIKAISIDGRDPGIGESSR
jgi:hypothetical protein